MRTLTRRRTLLAAAGCGVGVSGVVFATPARADFFGGDLPLLAAILGQSISQVSNLVSMLTQMVSQVRMMETMLKAVESGSFPALLSFIAQARSTFNMLTFGIRSMTYALSRIDAEFQQLFPGDPPPPGTTVAQHSSQMLAWHQEIIGASQVAARQQTSLAVLDDHAARTQAILQASQAADGMVAQLQLIAQMIGITNAQLILINQTLSTTGRVLTDMAAAGSAERLVSAAKKDDSRVGYTDKGAPVIVPHTLP